MHTCRNARYTQRGTSIIEGLVVLAMLALLLAFGIHFQRKYETALSRATDTRAAAWSSAIAGCERNPELQDDLAGLLKRTLPTNPRSATPAWNPLSTGNAPELVVRDLGSEAAVVVPCGERSKLKGAPIDQLQEPLVRRLLGPL